MPLHALLRTLKASGVRRYVSTKAGTEVEFWPTVEQEAAGVEEIVDRETERDTMRKDAKGPTYKDPLRAALEEFAPLESGADEDPEAEAN
jgi:hypothetical protein